MADRQALATRALKELRVIGEGQAASAGENADALAAIDPLLSRLRQQLVYAHQNKTAFEDDVFHPLAMLLAEDLAPSLAGRPRDERAVSMHEGILTLIQNKPLIRNELQFENAIKRRRRERFNG